MTLAAGAILACVLSGCANLKPVADQARFYVLSAESATTTPVAAGQSELAVGVGCVDIPGHLLDRRIAVCRGAHELAYLDNDRWAERLDRATQRVFAANLGALLPSDRVFLSAWRREEVGAEVYISIRRFECDPNGRIVVEASWRITAPGGERTIRASHLIVRREGPSFRADPAGAVNGLSQALADISQQIAADLRSVTPRMAPVSKEAALQ